METISKLGAIKEFMESGGNRKCTMEEFKTLSVDERNWLAEECAKKLGKQLTAN